LRVSGCGGVDQIKGSVGTCSAQVVVVASARCSGDGSTMSLLLSLWLHLQHPPKLPLRAHGGPRSEHALAPPDPTRRRSSRARGRALAPADPTHRHSSRAHGSAR
jgi:hypothetical protein